MGSSMKWSTCMVCLAGILLCLLSACGGGPSGSSPAANAAITAEAEAGDSAGDTEGKSESQLTLTTVQREKIGIASVAAAAANYSAESPGYGVVVGHESIAVASAEVATAQAAVRQSQAAVARVKQLAGTPGAMPSETAELAERQAAADSAALTLAERRLTALLGQGAPINAATSTLLAELATGQVKLVRVTFPLGSLSGPLPRRLRLARLDAASALNWTSDLVWEAPADATIPGRSFFTSLRSTNVGEGERLQVWASTSATINGAVVAESALIQSNSAYWCYIEDPAGSFTRIIVDTSRPVKGGYFVTEGIRPGAMIVTAGAGLLLARETNPSTEAEE